MYMNRQEEIRLIELSEQEQIADVLDRRAVRGYKDSVVEKYSDQAHFIYELLQNADDALATSARFVLEKDQLIFAHNGKRHFLLQILQMRMKILRIRLWAILIP